MDDVVLCREGLEVTVCHDCQIRISNFEEYYYLKKLLFRVFSLLQHTGMFFSNIRKKYQHL
jgi:hypothetical protein